MALLPAECELESFSLSKAYVTKSNSISCQKIGYFQATIKDLSNFLTVTPEVRLVISPESSNASFDYGSTIYIPLQLTFPGKYGSIHYGDSTQIEYILAHEYGHAVLAEFLSRNLFYSEMYKVDKEFSNLEFTKSLSGKLSTEQELKYNELKEKKNSYNKIRKLISDYGEFFADVIAVYYSNSKDTMFNAVYFDEMSDQSFQLALARSFSENSVDITDRIYHEEHASLVLVRQFIGSHLWPSNNEEKEIFLELITNSIEEEILQRLDREEYKLTPKKINESLINRLESKLLLLKKK